MLRFKLTSPSLGTLIIEESDPIGINELSQTVKRSGEYEGIIYEILINVQFIKKGRAFIIQAFETDGGIDAQVYVTLYEYNPNTRRWEHYANGKINFGNYQVADETVTVNIDKSGIEHRILNLIDIDVNHESSISQNGKRLPAYKAFNVKYHSKIITKESKLMPADNRVRNEDTGEIGPPQIRTYTATTEEIFFGTGGTGAQRLNNYSEWLWYSQIDLTRQVFADLTKVYQMGNEDTAIFFSDQLLLPTNPLGIGVLTNGEAQDWQYFGFLGKKAAKGNRNPLYEADELGDLTIDIQIQAQHKITAVGLGKIEVNGLNNRYMGFAEVVCWFEIRDSLDEIKSLREIGRWTMKEKPDNKLESEFETKKFHLDGVPVNIGDKFYVYQTFRIFGHYDPSASPFAEVTTITHILTSKFDPLQTWVSFTSATYSPVSYHETILLHEAVERCCQSYTNTVKCFYSDLLGRTDIGYPVDGEASLYGITSGNKLRGFNDKPILESLSDLLEFINARWCIGFGFEVMDNRMVFRLEKRSHFYNKDLRILSLGPVADIEKRLIEQVLLEPCGIRICRQA